MSSNAMTPEEYQRFRHISQAKEVTADNLDEKIDVRWVRLHAAPVACKLGQIPVIRLPNTDRDDGKWSLGIDRKHESTTVLLYCNFGTPQQSHRRIATIHTRRELVELYERLVGNGTWSKLLDERRP